MSSDFLNRNLIDFPHKLDNIRLQFCLFLEASTWFLIRSDVYIVKLIPAILVIISIANLQKTIICSC